MLKEMVVAKRNNIAVILNMICLSASLSAQGVTPADIFNQTAATYAAMHTYKAAGTIVADTDMGNMKVSITTSFSILLMKPNLYLISWSQKNMPAPPMVQDGTVWSDGIQPYLYMGIMKAYSKMSSDELALASATGVSGGAAFTIPWFFLRGDTPFSGLRDPVIEKTEQVEGEECYVISGTAARKETFWISKSSHLILKYSHSLDTNGEDLVPPDITDVQLDEALKGMGQQPTEETRKSMREMMNGSQALIKNMKITGSSTETHTNISSPPLSHMDFQFAPPKDAVMKESLFDSLMSGAK